jgi:hypothetical protein
MGVSFLFHTIESERLNSIHFLQGGTMKDLFKYIVFFAMGCRICAVLLGAEVPNIEKLSEKKLLEMIDRISKEVQSKRSEINLLSAHPTNENVLQLRMILHQNINHNIALMQEILEKRVYTTSPVDATVLRVFSESVMTLLDDLRTKILKACLRRQALNKRRSLPVPYKP